MAEFDYWIEAYPVNPPLDGKYGWAAKANIKRVGTGRLDDLITLRERWGKTESEARSKADEDAKMWITRQRD